MEKFKIADIVARKSYNMDILFKIVGIRGNEYDLVGLTVRIIADAPEYDLVHVSKDEAEKITTKEEVSRRSRINRSYSTMNKKYNIQNHMMYDNPNIYKRENIFKRPGVILHLDGDSEYCEKCSQNYKRMGLTAYTYNINEQEQYKQVYGLLQRIRPNILILTGHDAFYRRRNDIYNIDNYKNSKYYIQGVLEARRYEHNLDNLVIFAGACQSYYEAIISARS